MHPQIKETPNHNLSINNKNAFTDMDGRVIAHQPLNEAEKQAVAKHQQQNNFSKFKHMRPLSENRIAVELIKYYQQIDALRSTKSDYEALNNLEGFNNLHNFYSEKIDTLKKQLHEINPERLQEIETKRANDRTVNGAVEI